MLQVYFAVFVYLFITSADAIPRRLNPQCRSNVCDDRPECPKTTCRCLFASRMDCAIYYQCVNGKPYQYRCSPGLLFNPDSLTCDYSYKVNCPLNTTTSTTTEAASTTSTFIPSTIAPIKVSTTEVTENADTTLKTSTESPTTTPHKTTEEPTTTAKTGEPTTTAKTEEPTTTEKTEEPTTTEKTEEPTTTEKTEEPTTTEETEEPTTTEETEEPTTTEETEEPTTTEETEEPTTTEETEEPTTTEETEEPTTTEETEEPTTTDTSTTKVPTSKITTAEITEKSTTVETSKFPTSTLKTTSRATLETTTVTITSKIAEETTENSRTTFTSPNIMSTAVIPSAKFSCPTRFGLFADPKSCNRFYHCSHWIPYHKWCPSNLHFNPRLRVCDWPYRSGCDFISPATFAPEITPATLNPDSTSGTCDCEYCELPVPGDCSAYVLCIDGIASKMHCSPDLYFSPMTGTCDFPENVDCIEDDLQCPEPSGRYLLRGSCSYFMECHNGKKTIRTCPEGLQFNQSSEMCSWLGSCSGQKPDGLPSSKTTADAAICKGCDYCFKPHAEDCTRYIKCVQDTATEEHCASGLFFNPVTEMCDHDYNVECPGPHLQPKCPERFGYFPYPEDCGKYLKCINGSATLKTCPGVLHFDPVKKHCDWPWAAGCRDPDLNPTSAPSTNITDCDCDCCLKSFGTDCRSFILCINEVGFMKACSSGLQFNPQTENCDFPENVDCAITPEMPKYNCPEHQGLFPHPEECGKFIHCAHGFPYIKDCPSNLHFNPNLKVCDWPYAAGCQEFPTSEPPVDGNDLPCDICDSCFIPDESDCASYIFCRNGTGHRLRCTESLLFNPDTEACDLPSNVKCPNQPSSQCSSPNGLLPANECSQFIHCSNGIAYLKDCPEGLHFNPRALVCDWPENANCGEIPVQPTPPDDDNSGIINRTCDCDCCFLPDENDCSKYILCLDGYVHVGQCSKGLLFNPSIQNCDLAERVTCGGVSPLCPQPNGLFPNEKHCTSYIKCSGGVSKIEYCNNGTHFSAERKQCLDPCKANCDSSYDCESTTPTSSSTAAVSSSTTLSPYCPESDGLFPNADDCSSFYQCSGGRAYPIKCPPGLHFNFKNLVCDYPCEAKCNTSIDCEPSTTTSPTTSNLYCQAGDGLFPNEDDCSSFYQCHGGTRDLKKCPPGLHFSYKHQVCEQPCVAKCDGSIDCDSPVTTLSPFCPKSDGLFTNEDDCSSFYKCSDGRAYLVNCPAGLHFSHQHQVCTYPCEAKCDASIDCNPSSPSSTTSTAPPSSTLSPYCLEKEGLFPNEDDCASFYMCSGGRAYLLICPPGLDFSKEYQVCEYPCEANCNKSLDCRSVAPSTSPTPEVIPSTTPSPYCPERDGLFPNENDCTSFYKCSGGRAYLTKCPAGLHFSYQHQVCQYPCEAKCNASIICTPTTSEVISSTPSPHCPAADGLYPVPNDCTAFHLCSNGKEYLIPCPPDLHFSEVHETCEAPCTAKCNTSLDCMTSLKPVSSTPHPLSPECEEPDGLFPNPADCGSFYQCSSGRSHLIRCPSGLHFSLDDAACERPCVAGCNISTECPPEIPENKGNCTCDACYLPDPNDCSAFYFCDHGMLSKSYCPFGTLFSKASNVCEDGNTVDCEANGDPSMCPELYGFFPYPGDCRKFVHCDNGVAHVKECQEGLEYDQLSRVCTKPRGNCGEIVLDPNCPESTGLFPDPKNCSIFYHCEHGVAYPKRCSSPLMFNPEKGVCDWPDNVACGKDTTSSITSPSTISSSFPYFNISTPIVTPSSPPTSECYEVPGVICPCACRVPTYDECSSYYQCQEDGTACKKFCPEGLYFNKREMVCDLPENVECRDFFFTSIRRAKAMNHHLRR